MAAVRRSGVCRITGFSKEEFLRNLGLGGESRISAKATLAGYT